MAPPPHVAMILSPFIRLACLDDSARERLEAQGLALTRDASGFDAVEFETGEVDLLNSDELSTTCRRLVAAGMLFAEDFKQGWAPADVLRELQTRGRITTPFTALAWRGPGDWFTTIHAPNEAGRV